MQSTLSPCVTVRAYLPRLVAILLLLALFAAPSLRAQEWHVATLSVSHGPDGQWTNDFNCTAGVCGGGIYNHEPDIWGSGWVAKDAADDASISCATWANVSNPARIAPSAGQRALVLNDLFPRKYNNAAVQFRVVKHNDMDCRVEIRMPDGKTRKAGTYGD